MKTKSNSSLNTHLNKKPNLYHHMLIGEKKESLLMLKTKECADLVGPTLLLNVLKVTPPSTPDYSEFYHNNKSLLVSKTPTNAEELEDAMVLFVN